MDSFLQPPLASSHACQLAVRMSTRRSETHVKLSKLKVVFARLIFTDSVDVERVESKHTTHPLTHGLIMKTLGQSDL